MEIMTLKTSGSWVIELSCPLIALFEVKGCHSNMNFLSYGKELKNFWQAGRESLKEVHYELEDKLLENILGCSFS